jgi:hypothetical protein
MPPSSHEARQQALNAAWDAAEHARHAIDNNNFPSAATHAALAAAWAGIASAVTNEPGARPQAV